MFPRPSVWFIRVSLIYLMIGSSLGAILMLNKAFNLDPEIWRYLPLHYSILIWGFFIQLIMGTAYWMFPKFLSEKPRGSTWQVWFLFYSYNSGLVLFLITKFIFPFEFLVLIGKFLIFLGLITFIKIAWSRVISYNQ
ncbi:cbb3-type cytochrome c oxidase subunit I [Leptospira sp. 2 VSF19]|uniref:Cbb3-type cytochrome c oxidase subunit I n=1 Tax=Leptospira soteropolitanensis TaxID=2950025 RepID=A0AAW5VGK3_9LEPT|nr:hypothetical protein [Leptospira soteropolitanensis]MCW7491917.1 cbb3-type cytochrome c oxidase subunit I [Leptospira soteropolitanensis]MCW7499501.1 cbb3-type cytochrome c oxidase subunit I [Leptospira soteropolitanensis]MCW7520908.1 cbb3-type cytochrome c oxidase subunit I [Leptospira soteropolitanensis]MCW7525605.1 cbb3-type cytochrome c oxidase subunit I [Leptospira soteropolitanensis]MCW7529471.1 cbb3-type cytochrome c oxidase subunit I [Leptospira soteropolitanensis]